MLLYFIFVSLQYFTKYVRPSTAYTVHTTHTQCLRCFNVCIVKLYALLSKIPNSLVDGYLRTLSKAKGLRLRSDLSMLLGAGGLGRVKTSLTLAPSVSGPAPSLFWTLVTRSFDLKHHCKLCD